MSEFRSRDCFARRLPLMLLSEARPAVGGAHAAAVASAIMAVWLGSVGCSEGQPLTPIPPTAHSGSDDTTALGSSSLARPAAAARTVSTDRSESLPAILGLRRQGDDWPSFLGPAGNGTSREKGLPSEWASAGPPLVWYVELGTSYGSPAISRGRLFHYDRHGDQSRLTCRESETGVELWTYEHPTSYFDKLGFDNGPRCSPVVDADRVYIWSAEGILSCLSVSDGSFRWQLNLNRQFGVVQNFFGVGSTPIIYGDLLIANVGGSPPNSPPVESGRTRGQGSGVVAVDKFTGEIRYQVTDELASYASPMLASIDGRDWCFMFARGGLIGMNPVDGKVDFQFPWRSPKIESVNASNPVVVGDEVFISEVYGPGGALLRVREAGYDVIWRDEADSRARAMETHWNTPIEVDGYLYGSSGRHTSNAELRCIEWSTGEVQWSERRLTRSSLLYVDDHFVVLGEDGQVHIVRANPKKFERVAEFSPLSESGERLLEYPAWAAPVLSHGLLYLRGKDRLVCLDLITRQQP